MEPEAFKAARRRLGLTGAELAHILGISAQTVRKYEMPADASTARGVNPIAARVVGWLLAGWRPPEWPKGK